MTSEISPKIVRVRRWFEEAVIGLGLCPFAVEPWQAGRIRFVLSEAETENTLLHDLQTELVALNLAEPNVIETTVLVIGKMLQDFGDYNQLLGRADLLLEDEDWVGQFQIASFHPRYQFAGTNPGDVSNLTNCSPYPLLHLLREASVSRAVESQPDTEQIPVANIAKLKNLSDQERGNIFDFMP